MMCENTDPTSDENRGRSTAKPALKPLIFFLRVLVIYLVVMSLKIVELDFSFYFVIVDNQLNHRSSKKKVRLEEVF